MIDRVKGRGGAVETPIGLVPVPDALKLNGLPLSRADVDAPLRVDRDEWAAEAPTAAAPGRPVSPSGRAAADDGTPARPVRVV